MLAISPEKGVGVGVGVGVGIGVGVTAAVSFGGRIPSPQAPSSDTSSSTEIRIGMILPYLVITASDSERSSRMQLSCKFKVSF